MSIGIDVEHPVAYTHTQNGLVESLIKRLQIIARPLLMKSKLPVSAWGHAILHAASLVRIRPIAYHKFSPLQLILGQQPNIFHLRTFGCAHLVMLYMYLLHPHNALRWVLNVDLEFIRVLIPHLSLDILNL